MGKIVEPKYNGGPLVEAKYRTIGTGNVRFTLRELQARSFLNDEQLPDLEAVDVEPGYLSDRFDNGWMKKNLCNYGESFFIKAPTGSGKTHWVIHLLRVFAMMMGIKLLYLCNRTMLNRQIINEAISVTDPTRNENSFSDEKISVGKLTIMTYHRFYSICNEATYCGDNYFSQFKICVLDEVHFFFLDSMYNNKTGIILDDVVHKLRNSIRIYMSATPEPVITPILYAEAKEGLILRDEKGSIIPKKIFWMKEDDKKYKNVFFFDSSKERDPITKIIIKCFERNQKEKWIVFVSSKQKGKELYRSLEEKGIHPAYIDSESRKGDPKCRYEYEEISQGNLNKFDVLITTSVMDNGFSIHDSNVKHIVIYSDNRTEFLQELGRVRLEENQEVTVYTPFMDYTGFLNNSMRTTIMNTLLLYYGSKEFKEYDISGTDVNPDSIRAKNYLESADKNDSYKGVFHLKRNPHGCHDKYNISIEINEIVRWYMCVVSDERTEFDKLRSSCGKDTKIVDALYKYRWLCNDPDIITIENFHYKEITEFDEEEIISMFHEYLDRPMIRSGSSKDKTDEEELYIEFEMFFRKTYKMLFPSNKRINTSPTRPLMKPNTINDYFREMFEASLEYLVLEQKGEYWYLMEKRKSQS